MVAFDAEADHGIGAAICGSFAFFGILSVICYRPWRRWIENRRVKRFLERRDPDIEDRAEEPALQSEDSFTDDLAFTSNVGRIHVLTKSQAQDLPGYPS